MIADSSTTITGFEWPSPWGVDNTRVLTAWTSGKAGLSRTDRGARAPTPMR